MTGTNHFLTGAVIATYIDKPLAAIPLAFVSHFVLDGVPHFGARGWPEDKTHDKLLKKVWLGDALILACTMFVVLTKSASLLPFFAGLAAMSPDVIRTYSYIFTENWGKDLPQPWKHWFNKFHVKIQWGEFSRGLVIEIPYYIGLITLFLSQV